LQDESSLTREALPSTTTELVAEVDARPEVVTWTTPHLYGSLNGHRCGTHAALAGCVLGDVFLPEDPLVAGRTYEASGSWDLGGGARRTHTWTFTARRQTPPHMSVSRRGADRPLLAPE